MCHSPQFSSPLPYHQYNRYYKCQHEYQWPSFHPASRVCESSMGRKLQDKYKYKSSAPLSALPLQFRRERESWGSRDSHVTVREPASSTATGRVCPRPPHTVPLPSLWVHPAPAPHVPALPPATTSRPCWPPSPGCSHVPSSRSVIIFQPSTISAPLGVSFSLM